jgi:hypothetical protein
VSNTKNKDLYFVEIVTKDMRNLKFYVKDIFIAGIIREQIKKIAFYDINLHN